MASERFAGGPGRKDSGRTGEGQALWRRGSRGREQRFGIGFQGTRKEGFSANATAEGGSVSCLLLASILRPAQVCSGAQGSILLEGLACGRLLVLRRRWRRLFSQRKTPKSKVLGEEPRVPSEFLGRRVAWSRSGFTYQAVPKHTRVSHECNIAGCHGVAALGVEDERWEEVEVVFAGAVSAQRGLLGLLGPDLSHQRRGARP